MTKKTRLDQMLVDQGFFSSRERAQAAILAGLVLVEGQPCSKAGTQIKEGKRLEIKGKPHPYVSRGGLKLAQALELLQWDVSGWRIIDLGASTGGFTDCLLQRGASSICAVDVGRGQLDIKLQQDSRVIIKDKTNARYLTTEQLPFAADLVTADLSFISLRLLYPVIWQWSCPRLITLIKPQFETVAKNLRKGVVINKDIHKEVLHNSLSEAAAAGWQLLAITHSPVRGPAGNIEFVAGFTRQESKPASTVWPDLDQIVTQAHQLAV